MVHFKSLTEKLLSKYPNKIFVKTGTQHGYGIEVALECSFEKIYSIDIDPKYHGECSAKFKQEIEDGRIELFIGDTALVFNNILRKVDTPATFWLDAHSAAGIIGKFSCPLIQELDFISQHPIKNHTILVDDRRMFGHYWGAGTKEEEVIAALKKINSAYDISYADGCEPDDIIVAHIQNV